MRTSKTYFAPPVVASPQAAGFYHTVGRGQTIYRIGKLYHVSPQEVMSANNIKNPSTLEVGQRLFIPQRSFVPAQYSAPGTGPVSLAEARRIIGPRQTSYLWRTITVHHSGTQQGSARNFDRDHKRRKMGGLFYHKC